jgi:hypothetical protein
LGFFVDVELSKRSMMTMSTPESKVCNSAKKLPESQYNAEQEAVKEEKKTVSSFNARIRALNECESVGKKVQQTVDDGWEKSQLSEGVGLRRWPRPIMDGQIQPQRPPG